MIFVTVGTHEQQFNRLVECVDHLKKDGLIKEKVVIQTGYCTYKPKYCTCKDFFSYMDMQKLVNQARIVITHGGPSSFIMPLQIGKTPIVVPRQKKFNEHVNDHQVMFCNEVVKRNGTIIVVNDIENLNTVICTYNDVVKITNSNRKSNNKKFNADLEEIVKSMFEGKQE